MKKKVLVIGGTGFIGTNLLIKLIKNGYNVFATTTDLKKKKNIKGVKYIKLNFYNKKNLNQIKRPFNFIVNLSGYIDHRTYFKGGNHVIKNHLFSFFKIINSISKKELIKFIQIGSSDEYGNNKSPQSEKSREDAISPYSFSKISITHFLQMLSKTEKFPCVILRFFLVFGPHQKSNRLIPYIIKNFLLNKKISVSKNNIKKDFCYVDNICDAIIASFKIKKNGAIYNVGSGRGVSIKFLLKKIIKIQKKNNNHLINFNMNQTKIENKNLYPQTKNFFQETKWKPKISLENGLKKTIKFYQDILVKKSK